MINCQILQNDSFNQHAETAVVAKSNNLKLINKLT